MEAADVDSLLHEAGFRPPWADPERLNDLAAMLKTVAKLCAGVPISPEVALRRRAQRAVDELRRTLPDLVGWSFYHISNPSLLGTLPTPEGQAAHREHYARQAAAEAKLLVALVDLGKPPKRFPMVPNDAGHIQWHGAAIALFIALLPVVGRASTSRYGPGNKFVRLALAKAGYPTPLAEATEQALNRRQPQKTD